MCNTQPPTPKVKVIFLTEIYEFVLFPSGRGLMYCLQYSFNLLNSIFTHTYSMKLGMLMKNYVFFISMPSCIEV